MTLLSPVSDRTSVFIIELQENQRCMSGMKLFRPEDRKKSDFIIHFINNVLGENIIILITYSDSCGGQNKNKNIVTLFMFLVKATGLPEVHHKFLEPEHTFMECLFLSTEPMSSSLPAKNLQYTK